MVSSSYMVQAFEEAQKSTCLRRKVGAVLVKKGCVLITGANTVTAGAKTCDEAGCLRTKMDIPSGERHELCRAIHAEQVIISKAAKYGITIDGAELYVTCHPCAICAKMIVEAGIRTVYYAADYPDGIAAGILAAGDVLCEEMDVVS